MLKLCLLMAAILDGGRSTSKSVFSDPDLGSKWPPSADIVLT
jgi:hypothetical protein